THRGRNRTALYRCGGIDTATRCTVTHKAEALERKVWDAVRRVLREPKRLLALVEQTQTGVQAARAATPATAADLQAQHAPVEAQLQRLFHLFTTGRMSEAEFDAAAAPLRTAQQALATQLDATATAT